MDTMTQVCYESTYFSAPHIVDLPNKYLLGLAHQGHHVGNLGQSQIMGSLGDPAIPKSRGFWATPQRYVGHKILGSSSRAHPGPSRTYAPYASDMSVRIFGHFLPFPIFLARLALRSTPPCMPDAWTNGPHMVCSLCALVPMTQKPRGRTEASTHKELCQGESGQFCHFGSCEYNSGYDHAMAHGDLWNPSMCGPTLASHRVSNRTLSPISKPSWRNTLGILSILPHLLVCQNTPFSDPNFSFPCGQLAAPYLYAHEDRGSNFRSCT